ncbi:MAG: VacJ family lipoprotein [Pseudomonadales bacterium]|jgi:phospholipid-binding lipoprotein MlaA
MRMKNMSKAASQLFLVILLSAISSMSCADDKNPDPWEGLNRVTYGFNEVADKTVLKPVAKFYQWVTPSFIQRRVGNFFSNLQDVEAGVNNILQGKLRHGTSDFGRLIVNTTVGVGGLFDPATKLGLEKHREDFAQTLAVWGLPQGPYLVLPFLGPNTLTDALTNPLNPRLDPVLYLYPVNHRNVLFGVRAIQTRASLFAAEGAIFGDRYLFIRDAFLQRRAYLIADGEVEDAFDDF